MIDEKLCEEALQRFARDAGKPGDGELFYIYLQKILTFVPSFSATATGDQISGALRENLGRRKFASDLMVVMAEVMAEPIGDRASDEQRAKLAAGERPVIFQLPRPVKLVDDNQRGAKRRGGGHYDEPAAE